MEEKILEIFKVARNNGMTKEQVYKKLAYTNLSFEDFEEVFDDMKERHLIYERKKDLYTKNPFEQGKVIIKKNGEVLVRCKDQDINIAENTLNCVTGDIVKIKIKDFNENRGTICEVIERKGLSAEVITEKGKRYALLRNGNKYRININNNIVDGMIIGIKMSNDKKNKEPTAILDRVIGHKNRPRIDEETILYDNNFNYEWSNKIKEELKQLPDHVAKEDLIGRKDLRDKIIFTIDGDDTKDIDDAISLEKLPNGNFKLGVHIADVSHYVKEGSAVFKEAVARGTSVYMNTIVNPQLPVELSNGICSLNPEVDRLTLTFDMEITPKGKIDKFDVYESVINSRKKMTYNKVNEILEKGETPEGYEEYVDILKEMNNLSHILRKNRIKRGYQNFDLPEIKIETDENGIPTKIKQRTQGEGEKLIEQFMLAANEGAATYILSLGVPFIYRDHDLPDEERLKRVINVIRNYGDELDIKGKLASPRYIQELLKQVEKTTRKEVYSNMILRCLAKAEYKEYNIGHFSIGIDSERKEAYGHVTSPIRRLPDLINHIILKNIIHGKINKLYSEEFKSTIANLANHASVQERNADKCEIESNKMKTAEYMSNFIKEKYDATIIAFTNNGMFVQLPNLVEGRIDYSTMDDYYNYNEEFEILVGERSNKIYRLGDKIPVTLVKASKEAREIDFEIDKPKVRTRKIA